MSLSKLTPAKGSVKKSKRIGRGVGSGKGRTAARGLNGQKSRSGYSRKRAFEGGQMPLQIRLPKRGFKSRNRVEYVPLNLSRLNEIAEKYNATTINIDFLLEKGIVRKNDLVKILGHGTLKSGLTVEAHACSTNAKEAIVKAGGNISLIGDSE